MGVRVPPLAPMNNSSSRYQRQQRLPQIGTDGQQALASSRVGLVGLGALGSFSAELLARAGVGQLLLIDRDIVEWSNLQRQSLYCEADADSGLPKVVAAATRLGAINSEIELEVKAIDLCAANINSALSGCDLVLDGSDNFAVRYLLNDWAVSTASPFVYAGAVSTYGMSGAIMPTQACLRCTWPEPPDASDAPSCRSAGVLGPIIASISSYASAEAIKILVGAKDALNPGYFMQDLWRNEARNLRASKDPNCPCCVQGQFPWLDGEHEQTPLVMCGNNSVQLPPLTPSDLQSAASKLAETVNIISCNSHLLRFDCNDLEVLLFADGRVLVRGTDDPARARSIVARTLGS